MVDNLEANVWQFINASASVSLCVTAHFSLEGIQGMSQLFEILLGITLLNENCEY